MIKLGERKKTNRGTEMWGYVITEVWLLKWKPTKNYIVMGLCKDEDNKAQGWCTMFDGSLKEARRYVETH